MLQNQSKLEIKIEDKIYQFICDPNSSLQNCKEALFQFLKYIGKIEDEAIKAEQESKLSETKSECM